MRQDCFTEYNGKKCLDLYKMIGTGYERGWFSNCYEIDENGKKCYCRYRIFAGARSTKKSKVIMGYEVIMRIMSDARNNVLMVRMNDCDHRQSTFENLVGCIYDMGLEKEFKITKQPLEIERISTHQKILFRGMSNPTSLNSIAVSSGYLNSVYIEEAFEIASYDDFRKLDGSIRGKLPEGMFQQVTLCLNPWNEETWIAKEFCKGRLMPTPDEMGADGVTHLEYINAFEYGPYGRGIYIFFGNFLLNEFRDKDVYDKAAEEMKRRSPDIYNTEFLGCFGATSGRVYSEFNDTCIEPLQKILEYDIIDFAIGIDTGLSSGDGKIKKVLKHQDREQIVRSATTMSLVGITSGYDKIISIDEYFHSNNMSDNQSNTDNRENLEIVQLADALINKIIEWSRFYGQMNSRRTSNLMRGTINVYIDSADIGTRQVLDAKAKEYGIYNIRFMASTKISIQSRIDFYKLMMAYGDFKVCQEKCPNLIRELKYARKGEDQAPRADGNDHQLNSHEYGTTPLLANLRRWKNFKVH